jgi:NNP family nitrate/nitrite transporter-like MFS transporter
LAPSFNWFSFAFGQVLLVQFPQDFPNPAQAAAVTFIGPLTGAYLAFYANCFAVTWTVYIRRGQHALEGV